MYSKLLAELLSTRYWMIELGTGHAMADAIVHNMNIRMSKEDLERTDNGKKGSYSILYRNGVEEAERAYVGDISEIKSKLYWRDIELTDEDEIVNIIEIDGPITREGGACSYGAKEIRDMLLEFSSIPQVKGYVFLINTPGGSAYALNDFKQGIDAVKNAGQRTIGLVDGMCLSAGMGLACQLDYITAFNHACELGCIGAMLMGWVHRLGDEDSYMGHYVELVSACSPDKNVIYRNAAEGDYELAQEHINALGIEFQRLVQTCRPSVLDEQLTGKVYRASDVFGTLCDGIASMDECINYALTGNAGFSVLTAPQQTGNGEGTSKNQSTITNMETKNIKEALNLEELHVEENGVFLNTELVEQLENVLGNHATSIMEKEHAYSEAMDQMKKEHDEELEKLNKSHEDAITELNKSHEDAIAEKGKEIAALQEENEKLAQSTTHAPIPAKKEMDAQPKGKPWDQMTPSEKAAYWKGN